MSSGRRRNKQKDEGAAEARTAPAGRKGSNASRNNLTQDELEEIDEGLQSRIEGMSSTEQGAFRNRLDPTMPCPEEEKEFSFLRTSVNAAQKRMYLSARN